MDINRRQHTVPVVINSLDDTIAHPLHRLPLNEKMFDEGFLQGLLAKYPNLIPIEEIEPAFEPLISLGREIPTKVGPIDLLYVSPAGYLVIVEAKLWRNPEARRKVVGQIIDYAKEVSSWSYSDLEAAVIRSKHFSCSSIFKAVTETGEDLDEADFVDSVARNLKKGHFLLLIAGNGIRENVESMAEYLQGNPSLHFSLALVEFSVFRMNDKKEWPILIQPRIVARTIEVVRAIVDISSKARRDMDISVMLPAERDGEITPKRRVLSESVFYDELTSNIGSKNSEQIRGLADELSDLGIFPVWRASTASFRFSDPNNPDKQFTIIVIWITGEFFLRSLEHIEIAGYGSAIWKHYLDKVCKLTSATLNKNKTGTRYLNIDKLLPSSAEYIAEVRCLVKSIEEQAMNSDTNY